MTALVERPWIAAVVVLGFSGPAFADDVLFENVRIFDGTSAELSAPSNVLVKGNLIDLVADAATNFKVIMKDGTIYKNTLGG